MDGETTRLFVDRVDRHRTRRSARGRHHQCREQEGCGCVTHIDSASQWPGGTRNPVLSECRKRPEGPQRTRAVQRNAPSDSIAGARRGST